MNFGFTLLSIGSLVLMMVVVINANRLIVSSDAQSIESEQTNHAVALGEAMMGEMRLKKFDHFAIDDSAQASSSFTYPLGPEPGIEVDSCMGLGIDSTDYRSTKWYTDIDDYDGYIRFVRVPGVGNYLMTVQVQYVSETDYSTPSTQTYLKKIVVTVQNQSTMPVSSLKLSSIQAY